MSFGAGAVLCLPGTADAYNDKALRASAGAAFGMKVVGVTWDEARGELTGRGFRLVATVPRSGVVPQDLDWNGRVCLMIGGEGAGLTKELAESADVRVSIAMAHELESLNAAVAAAILLYEAARRR